MRDLSSPTRDRTHDPCPRSPPLVPSERHALGLLIQEGAQASALAAPEVWGRSVPPLQAPRPSPGLGPLRWGSQPLAQGLGCCPQSVWWLLLDLGSPLKGPLLGRPSLTPGILRWLVFSLVLCPSPGLSSMRTSSPQPGSLLHPRLHCREPVCSLHPPQGRQKHQGPDGGPYISQGPLTAPGGLPSTLSLRPSTPTAAWPC